MRLQSLALCAVLASASACGGDSPSGGPDAYTPPVDAPVDTATIDAFVPIDAPATMTVGRLRFVHATAFVDPTLALPNANLDIYVVRGQTSTRLFANAAVNSATAYAEIPTGRIRLAVRPAGAAVSTAPLYNSDELEIVEGASITSFGAGILGEQASETAKFRITNVVDSFPAAVAGKVQARVVNLSHATTGLGVDIADDGTIEVPSLDRYAVSAATGVPLATGADLGVAIKTTATTPTTLATLTVPATALVDGSQQYVVIAGLNTVRARDPRGLKLLLVRGNATAVVQLDPQIYLLAATPEPASATVAAFDAFIGTAKRFDSVAFGALKSTRLKPTATGYPLDIHPHTAAATPPTSAPLASLSTGPLEAGGQYLLVLDGLVSDSTLGLRVIKDELQTALDTTGKLRPLHAVHGLAAADFGWFDVATATWHDVDGFANLAPGAASLPASGMPIAADGAAVSFRPGLRPTGDATAQVAFGTTPQQMVASDRWYAVAIGAWTPAAGQQAARIVLVKTAAGAWTTTSIARTTALRRLRAGTQSARTRATARSDGGRATRSR